MSQDPSTSGLYTLSLHDALPISGLTGRATAVDACDHVEAPHEVQDGERGIDQLLVQLVREVLLQAAPVDLPGAGARHEARAGYGFLDRKSVVEGTGGWARGQRRVRCADRVRGGRASVRG